MKTFFSSFNIPKHVHQDWKKKIQNDGKYFKSTYLVRDTVHKAQTPSLLSEKHLYSTQEPKADIF